MNKIIVIDTDGKQKIFEDSKFLEGITVYFIAGDNNCIMIHEPYQINNLVFLISGNNNLIEIGSNSEIRSGTFYLSTPADNRRVIIGKHVFIGEVKFQLYDYNSSIEIGEDCLFSSDVVIQTDDGFSIYDIETKKLVNNVRETKIGNHVWLGYGVFVSGGSLLPNNTIVAARSVVSGEFDEIFTSIGGNPAKVIKRGINFSKLLIKYFK